MSAINTNKCKELIQIIRDAEYMDEINDLSKQLTFDDDLIGCLINSLWEKDKRQIQKVSWLLTKYSDKYPEAFIKYVGKLTSLLETTENGSTKRNVVRIFQNIDIPKKFETKVYDICLRFLDNSEEAIAVKAFAMTVLVNIAKSYPELLSEVRMHIENQIYKHKSAGIKSRGSNELKRIKNILKR